MDFNSLLNCLLTVVKQFIKLLISVCVCVSVKIFVICNMSVSCVSAYRGDNWLLSY